MELKLVLPLPTSINKLYINEYNWKYNPKTRKKERMPTGRRILSPEGRKVKARIQGEARVQLEQQLDNWDYEWTKENFCYQDALIVFTRRGSDDNNVYKLLNDSLENIVYDNDSRVLVRTQHIESFSIEHLPFLYLEQPFSPPNSHLASNSSYE